MNIDLLKLIGIIGTLLLVGYFSGIEIAFLTANKFSFELKKKQGRKSGRMLSQLFDNPGKFISATLAGLITVMVVYGLLVGEFLSPIWDWFEGHLPDTLAPYVKYVRLVFETIVSTAIILIVQVLFRATFKAKNDTLLSFFGTLNVLNFFQSLFAPLAALFTALSEWVLKYLFNVRVSESKMVTRIDLDHFLQQSKEQGDNNEDLNTELFENALQLPSVKIRQCLVPRKEIEAIEKTTPIDIVKKKFIETKLSKLVVYESNIDTILGYVHQLDMFKRPTSIEAIMHPIPAVPESMNAVDLINKFSRERKSIAWVVDEFGGTAGIITMEDLLEEIFGEIRDEYDTEEFVEKQISDNEYIFSGRLKLDYLNQKYDLDFPQSDSETLSGFVISHHEAIPRLKERIIIDNYEFDIVNVSDTRIEMMKVKKLS